MPRNKKSERVFDGGAKIRATALRGINNPVAVALYDESMRTLTERGADSYMAALQLRDACAWTEIIEDISRQLRRTTAGGEATQTQLRALMRNKAVAENARTRILDSLLLIPQRPRGRPRGDASEDSLQSEETDAWEAFDDNAAHADAFEDAGKTARADAFEDGDGS